MNNSLVLRFIAAAAFMQIATMHYARADADCPVHPKSEWASEDAVRKMAADAGIKIKKFKISGECYEIYGRNEEGKKVEIYFDAKTLAVVKAEVEK